MPRFATPCGAMQFEQYGARADAPVLLIHDAGLQLVQWPPSLIDGLVAAGFRAIVFDNRDAGLSFGVEAVKVDLAGIVAAGASARGVEAPYTLSDMAQDACRLLDHLGQAGAHVIGFSLGGMIAQRLAIHHPERVFSWTSINATSGAFPLPTPDEDLLPAFAEPSRNQTDIIERTVACARRLGGAHHDSAAVGLGRFATAAHARAYRPEGAARQLLAGAADGDRSALLRRSRIPALVIHGEANPLFPVAEARHTALDAPGSRLVVIPELGHDLPEPLIPALVDHVVALLRAADAPR